MNNLQNLFIHNKIIIIIINLKKNKFLIPIKKIIIKKKKNQCFI